MNIFFQTDCLQKFLNSSLIDLQLFESMKHFHMFSCSHFLPQNIKLRTHSNNFSDSCDIVFYIDVVNKSLSSWFCDCPYEYIDEGWFACSVLAEQTDYLSFFEMGGYSVQGEYFIIVIFLEVCYFY